MKKIPLIFSRTPGIESSHQSSALPGVLLIAAQIFSFLKKGWDSKIWFQKWKVQRILQVSVVITSGSSEQTVDRQ